MGDSTMGDTGPVPAGFLARYAAWSLDAAMVAVAAVLLTWRGMVAGAASLRAAWTGFLQIVGARMADALTQVVDPSGLAAQLMQDAALRSAAAAVETALRALLLPPMLTFTALAALYWIGFERSACQATPGKRALALQVTDLDGHRLGAARAAARHFAGALSWLTLNLGHALAAVPPQKRALHDYVAGTRVVRNDADPRLRGWAAAWIALQVAAGFALVAWLLLRYVAALQGLVPQA